VTVLEVIQKCTEFLARKGVESPRLQTELLLAHVLNLPRMKLYLDFARTLSPPELDILRELVRRRGQREPLQHILGSTSFCGLELAVNRHVLVPRPETELLADQLMVVQIVMRLHEGLVAGALRGPDPANGQMLQHVLLVGGRAAEFGFGHGPRAKDGFAMFRRK